MRNPQIVVLGGGYLGKKIAEYFDCQLVTDHIWDATDLVEAIDLPEGEKHPTIINCIGKTGRPNVDWCEDHKPETYFANVHIPYLLAEYCNKYGVKLVHISSGCIYSGDGEFAEDDEPNFQGSYYSHTKYVAERLLMGFENLNKLILRIRMPVDSDVSERNLINKLLRYDRVIETKNSVTIIPDFIDLIIQ